MSVYGKINVNDFTIVDSKFHKTKLLNNDTAGVSRVQALSGSYDAVDAHNPINAPNTGSSHWFSQRVLFYSQSFGAGAALDAGISLFESSPKSKSHSHKFYDTASVFYIPQLYFGEEIKRKSFKFTDTSHPSGSVTIQDDGQGNLFSVNHNISRSNNSPSSSENYVGNIFYNSGIFNITDTGSYLHTTPSTATIIVGGGDVPFIKDDVSSFFNISSSKIFGGASSIKFLCTSDGSGTDTDTLKHFSSASITSGDKGKTLIAANAVNKINSVFAGNHISASHATNIITLTNDAKKMFNKRPFNVGDNLPPISGSSGFTTSSGFEGGTAPIFYQNIGSTTGSSGAYSIKFDSTQTFYIRQWTVKLKPNSWMQSMNQSARGLMSGSNTTKSSIHMHSPLPNPALTGSGWSPYVSQIALYNDTEIQKVYGENGESQLKFSEPLIIANLPRAIKMRDDMTIIFKIKLDY